MKVQLSSLLQPARLKAKLRFLFGFGMIALGIPGGNALAGEKDNHRRSTFEDFLRMDVKPAAIGHHGVGPNRGENPALPVENTLESVWMAYDEGAIVVEVDVQLTRDGQLVAFRDDFLEDFTCIHDLTFVQLRKRLPHVPELSEVLKVARHFNKKAKGELGGLLIIELKAPSPHCDPRDVLERPLVTAAIRAVRRAEMTRQVLFDSFSPSLLKLASQMAPEIPRELDISGLQLLTPEQVTAITGQPVTVITKKISLGLTWANIGPVYRLPGYTSVQQFLATGMAVRARVVGAELNFLGPAEQQQAGSGAAFVNAAHALGFNVFANPAESEGDWQFFESLGVDGIYSNIPLGSDLQPELPDLAEIRSTWSAGGSR